MFTQNFTNNIAYHVSFNIDMTFWIKNVKNFCLNKLVSNKVKKFLVLEVKTSALVDIFDIEKMNKFFFLLPLLLTQSSYIILVNYFKIIVQIEKLVLNIKVNSLAIWFKV